MNDTGYHNKDCYACEYQANQGRSRVAVAESSLLLLLATILPLSLIIYRPSSEEIKLWGNIIIQFTDNHGGKMLIAALCYAAIRNIDLSPSGISFSHTCRGGRWSNNTLYSGVGTIDSATRDYVKQNKEGSSNE